MASPSSKMKINSSEHFENMLLVAQAEQMNLARRGDGDPDSVEKDGLFEQDLILLDVVKDRLVEDLEPCKDDCICKMAKYVVEHHHREPRSPARKIISHRFHGAKLFLLCLLESEFSRPEYLRLCQVPENVRVEYRDYLEEHKRPPNIKDHWNMQQEAELFRRLYDPLDAKHARQQEELRQCVDTVEWCERTNNGKMALATCPVETGVIDRPPAAMENGQGEFWEVESVLGALVAQNTGKLWFLVKWQGYPHEENSWEPHHGLQMSGDLIQHFYNTYGRPTRSNPKILSPDGDKFEKWVKACEKEKQQTKKIRKQ